MIRSFRDSATQDVFDGRSSKKARRAIPRTLWDVAARKLEQLDSVIALDELRIPSKNRLEALKGNRRGEYSIRINDQYRICFVWTEFGPKNVVIVDYHGSKRG